MNPFVLFFWFAAIIAVAFFLYSAINRQKLELSWSHPRILVEFGLFLLFLLLGLVFMN
ncbi:MAG: hypothetical protein JSW33_07135 [bacterium]|nr:MAG: hypothetical protein JSW33_07135 [bacterium]